MNVGIRGKSPFDRNITDRQSFQCNTYPQPVNSWMASAISSVFQSTEVIRTSFHQSRGLNHLTARSPPPLFFHIEWIAYRFQIDMRNLGIYTPPIYSMWAVAVMLTVRSPF